MSEKTSEIEIQRRLRGNFTQEEMKDVQEFPLRIEGDKKLLQPGSTFYGSGKAHSHEITVKVIAIPETVLDLLRPSPPPSKAQQPHFGLQLGDGDVLVNLNRFKSIEELTAFFQAEFAKKQVGNKEILLYDAVEIVQKFHDGTLNLPLSMGPERWAIEAEKMTSAEIEAHIANNQALLLKFESFENDLKKQTTELTDSRRLGEILDDGLTQATADAKLQAEYLEERAKDIEIVKNATPVLQQVVQTLGAALEKRRSERPSEAEVEKVKKTLNDMQNQAKDISLKFDKLHERLTFMEANVKPGHEKVEQKMRQLLVECKQLETEFRRFKTANKNIEEIQDWSLPHPHNVPLRFQHAYSPWVKGTPHS